MESIREIVNEALSTGYLSVEAEDKLRQMLRCKYDFEDFLAFIKLQKAATIGLVTQESRELLMAKS